MTALGNCCTRIYKMTFGSCFRPSAKKKLEEACNKVAEDSLTNQRKGPIHAKNRKMRPIEDRISRGERIRLDSVRLYEQSLAKGKSDANNSPPKLTQDPRNRDVKTLSDYCSEIYTATIGRCFRACSKRSLEGAYENCLASLKGCLTRAENPLVRRARELEEKVRTAQQRHQTAENTVITITTISANNVTAMREGGLRYHLSIKK